MNKSHDGSGLREWQAGWTLVFAACIGISVQTYYLSSISVVMKALGDEFGWSRGEISSVSAIKSTVLILCSPFLGYFVDKIGARRIAIPGLILYSLGTVSISLVGPSIWSWYIVWGIVAFAGVAISSTIWTAAVASRFDNQRGLALGITLAGHGLTSAIIPFVSVWALEAFGWRGVYVVLGFMAFATALPPVLLLFFDARDLAGKKASTHRAMTANTVLPGFSFAEAIRQTRYWRLALAMVIGGGAVGALQLHLVPMMTDGGMELSTAAAVFALLGPATIAGRLLGGFLMDRFFPPYIAALIFALPMIDCLLLLQFGASETSSVFIVLLAGFALGAEVDTISVLASRYFGLRAYGRVYAPLVAIFAVGFGYSGAIAGVVYDKTGSYDSVLILLVVALTVSIALLLTLGRFPEFDAVTADAKETPPAIPPDPALAV
ncbi:L-lactate transporter [Alphaproteobacteria bacterium SO-S41]|nr:L-lactate transporter [Alphaproteobacteria bacterium SO-S41]